MKKPKKRDALKMACLQAAATVWASGKLHTHYSSQTPQAQADAIADFALILYEAWTKKAAESPDIRKVIEDLNTLAEPADKAPTAPSAGKAP